MKGMFRLRIERGTGPHSELVITAAHITIGRDPGAAFVVHGDDVSLLHCEIQRDPDGFRIRDLGSLHGTRVSGTPVREALLPDEARITLGETELSFSRLEADVPSSRGSASRRSRYARAGRRTEVTALPFKHAKSKLLERFEREYVATMLEQCGGNITAAAQSAKLHRVHFLRLMDRHGLRRPKAKSV